MMKKRVATGIVTAILIVTMVGMTMGCGGGTGDSAPSGGSSAPVGESDLSSTAEGKPAELRTVTSLCRYYANASRPWNNADTWDEKETNKIFNEELAKRGLKLELETIPFEQYSEAIKTRVATNLDLPDIVLDNVSSDREAVGYGKSGIIQDVKALIDQYDDDGSIWKYMNDVAPSAMKTIIDTDGSLWWFPYVYSDRGINDDGSAADFYGSAYTISIREDWLKKCDLDYQIFYTPEEFYSVLATMREKDANENGAQDEVVGVNITSGATGFEAGFGIGSGLIYFLSDGNGPQCQLDHENFNAYMQYLQKLYQSGLFDTAVLNGENMVSSNRASMIFSYSAEVWEEQGIAGYEDTAVYSPIVLDDDEGENGFMYGLRDGLDAVYRGWFISASCKEPEAAVDLMDYVYSDEFEKLAQWGVEGVTYELNDMGCVTMLGDRNELFVEGAAYTPLAATIAYNAVPNCYNAISTKETFLNQQGRPGYDLKSAFNEFIWDNDYKAVWTMGGQPLAMATDEEQTIVERYSTTINTYYSELMMDLVIGKKSLDDMDKYRSELEGMGLKEYIKTFETRFERYQELVKGK